VQLKLKPQQVASIKQRGMRDKNSPDSSIAPSGLLAACSDTISTLSLTEKNHDFTKNVANRTAVI
jgi:hypothetical protein